MKKDLFSLQNKVCIVTGAGSHHGKVGNAKATAICFTREGAKVIVAVVSEENAKKMFQQISSDNL